MGLPVISHAERPVRFAEVIFAPSRLTSWNIALERLALVSVVPTNELLVSWIYFKSALVRLAVGPIKYPPINCQPVGSALGVPLIPPEVTFVKVALVRFASARFTELRLALARLAVGPIRYPLFNCHPVGSALGVPLTPPEVTFVKVALAR